MNAEPFLLLLISLTSIVSCPRPERKKNSGQDKNAEKKGPKKDATVLKAAAASEEYVEYDANGTCRRSKPAEYDKKNKDKSKKHNKPKNPSALDPNDPQVQTYFNRIERISEPSSVQDERINPKPFMTSADPNYSDFLISQRIKALSQLPKATKIQTQSPESNRPDNIGDYVDTAVLNSHFDDSYDGGVAVGNSVYDPILGKVPPPQMRDHDPNFEPDPFAVDYVDPLTSQKELYSHIGRSYGRDGKPKNVERRNTFSSINDNGCIIC